jgi:hypothetical protein
LSEVESLLGGIRRRVVLGFTRGLGHTSMLLGHVVDGPASEGEEIARAGLAGAAVVSHVSVGKACELETMVRGPPPNVRRMSMVPWRYRRTFFRACRWASVGEAWAVPRMLHAVETLGRVLTAAYWRLPSRLG